MAQTPPDRLTRLALLERCYDGPVPADEILALSESRGCWVKDLHTFHQRLAVVACGAAARRRRRLTARASIADSWLSRLTLTLAGHRKEAVAALETAYRN